MGIARSNSTGLTLATEGRSNCVIIVSKDAPAPEQHAARELADFLGQVTGAKFEIRPADKTGGGARIAVGPAAAIQLAPNLDLKGLGPDGIVIQTHPPHLILTGAPGAPRGTLYAVYTFLEEVVGCRWWTPKVSRIPRKTTLEIPQLDIRYAPVLEYREMFSFSAFDPDWAVRNRMNGHRPELDEKRGGKISYKGFAHTFGQMVPPEEHFQEHPEWFSQIDGKRVSEKSQLCLTDKHLLDFVIRRVEQWLREDPQADIVSVSQNDNENRCQCPRCLEIESEESSPAGPLLRFVNAVAEAIEKDHPHVAIDTLAYLHTRKPPRITRPRRNVIVRLCSIECSFAHPLSHDRNRSFRNDIIGWSKICDRLCVWDYVTNFDNYIQPHPNLCVLGPNVRFFAEHGVKGVFEQGNSQSPCGEMAELRAWVLAKLMWNPQADEKKLIKEFLAGYYEDAAPFVQKYLNLIHDEVERTDFYMRCYVSPDAPFLAPEVILQAEGIFQDAEQAVEDKPDVLGRVKVAHLPVRFVAIVRWPEMRQAVDEPERQWPFPLMRLDAISEFERVCNDNNITLLEEDWPWPNPGRNIGWLREQFGG